MRCSQCFDVAGVRDMTLQPSMVSLGLQGDGYWLIRKPMKGCCLFALHCRPIRMLFAWRVERHLANLPGCGGKEIWELARSSHKLFG